MQNAALRQVQVVVGFVRRAGAEAGSPQELLLVQQRGARDPAPYWTLPSGKVEPGETLWEAMRRELSEESGLHSVPPYPLVYVAQYHSEPHGTHWTSYAFEMPHWENPAGPHAPPCPQDPDAIVLDAQFFPLPRARELIAEYQPLLVMSHAPLAYLDGAAPRGSCWFFHRHSDGREELLRDGLRERKI